MLMFARSEEKSTNFFWCPRDEQQRSVFWHYAVADWTESFRSSLVLDWMFVDQTELWIDLEDMTERLSSLEKFMQIGPQSEVYSKK